MIGARLSAIRQEEDEKENFDERAEFNCFRRLERVLSGVCLLDCLEDREWFKQEASREGVLRGGKVSIY